MNILPKWAMIFSVCIPVIGQLIFFYIVYNSYVNLQFIRPETTRSLVKDLLLVALTGGLFILFLVPLFFREVSLGSKRLNVSLLNYPLISGIVTAFLFFVGIIFLPIQATFMTGWVGLWFIAPILYTYLLITPFEKIHKEYEAYL